MKLRSYYATTVEEAVSRASSEMGPDAMLVRSRKSPLEVRHLGPFEVIFAVPPAQQEGGGKASFREVMGMTNGRPGPEEGHLSAEVSQMRRQMEEIRSLLVARNLLTPQSPPAEPLYKGACRLLQLTGMEPELAEEIARAVETRAGDEMQEANETGADLSLVGFPRMDPSGDLPSRSLLPEGGSGQELRRLLEAELRLRIPSPLRLEPPPERVRILALVGPPGAGKTSALMKLAVMHGQSATRPVHLLSADTYRLGAPEQLRSFAAVTGMGIDFCESAQALGQAIEANRHKGMLLIDTPGLSGSDFELLDELALFLGRRDDIEKHLVLMAGLRPGDLRRCVQQYGKFRPDRLLFTHVDETDAFGSPYSVMVRSAKPVSYLSAGQQIPEDLEEAAPEKMMRLLLEVAASDEAAAEPAA